MTVDAGSTVCRPNRAARMSGSAFRAAGCFYTFLNGTGRLLGEKNRASSAENAYALALEDVSAKPTSAVNSTIRCGGKSFPWPANISLASPIQTRPGPAFYFDT
jgi:hypothetical protein